MTTQTIPSLPVILQGITDAHTTKYLSIAGTVMLLYDHALTFQDEYRYIWKASNSFAKWAFLFNRYLVPTMLILVANEMCGFNGLRYTDSGCRVFLIALAMVAMLSPALANILVLMRVLSLWRERRVKIFLSVTCAISVSVAFSMMLITCIKLRPTMQWSPVVNMCIITKKVSTFAVTWGAPLFFEISVLACVVYNTISLPRAAVVPLTRALRRDGVVFFLTVTVLRLSNMLISVIARPSLTLVGIFFLWAVITLTLNRSLLSLRRAELEDSRPDSEILLVGRAKSPFILGNETPTSTAADPWT